MSEISEQQKSACESILLDFSRSSGADSIAIWMFVGGHLHARICPLEPGVIGINQRLSSGLISRVFLTGQSILENDLPGNPFHDPSVDRQLGRRCSAIMAAAVDDGRDGGVVSAVLLENQESGRCFMLSDLERLSRLAGELGAILRPPR